MVPGLMVGVDLASLDAPAVVAAGRAEGFLLNATGPGTLRFVPPLILTEDDVSELVGAWPAIVGRAAESGGAA